MILRSGSTIQSVRKYTGRMKRLCRPAPNHDPITLMMMAKETMRLA